MEGVVTISSNDKQKMTKFQILFTGVTFFILGIASMIPRSSFTLNLPLLYTLLTKNNHYLLDFLKYGFTLFSVISHLFGEILNLFFGYKLSTTLRIIIVQIGLICCLIVQSVIIVLNINQRTLFILNVLCIFIMNVLNPFFISAMISEASYFNIIGICFYLSGRSFSQIIFTCIDISIHIFDDTISFKNILTIIYIPSVLILILAAILYYILFTRRWYHAQIETQITDTRNIIKIMKKSVRLYIRVFKKIWKRFFILIITFFISLIVMPSIISQMVSESGSTEWRKHFPLFLQLFFYMSDFVGIFMANVIRLRKDDQFKAFLLATIRIAFIPLFLICKRNIEGKIFPTYIEYDAAVIVIIVVFGVAHGYLYGINFIKLIKINGRDMRDTSAAYLVAACGVGSGMAEISELGIRYL